MMTTMETLRIQSNLHKKAFPMFSGHTHVDMLNYLKLHSSNFPQSEVILANRI